MKELRRFLKTINIKCRAKGTGVKLYFYENPNGTYNKDNTETFVAQKLIDNKNKINKLGYALQIIFYKGKAVATSLINNRTQSNNKISYSN